MILYSCFLFQTLYQDLFCIPKPTPLTVRAKIVISPSINDEFCLGSVRVMNIIFITIIIIIIIIINIIIIIILNNIIIITTISMIISLDLLTGGIKMVGNQGLVILYCNAIQAYQ